MNISFSQKLTANAKKSGLIARVILLTDEKQLIAPLPKSQADLADRVQNLLNLTDFSGKVGETLLDLGLSEAGANPLLLVGVGKSAAIKPAHWQKIAKAIVATLGNKVEQAHILLEKGLDAEQAEACFLALFNASYRFDKYKTDAKPSKLQNLTLIADKSLQAAFKFSQDVFAGQALCCDLANEPGNVIYPESLAEQAKTLAKTYADVLKVSIIDEKKMQKLSMNCFLAVSQGSSREGKLIVLEYQGKSAFSKKSPSVEDAPIALVGKGVTFDTGGICLKPAQGMEEMKFDMGGAAAVIGTIKALCESRLPINVVGLLACAENMPSGTATRPGDIVTAMNGKTVEIINTDAEGRLVLADTLCYAQRYQPKTLIDVATLTGACVIALGHIRSGLYSNNTDTLFALENAGEQSGDLVWPMPLDDEYQLQIDSNIADIQNVGGRAAGSVTAACFLSRFVEEDQAWAHLDIAGTAWQSGKDKSATGRPVPLFMYYLRQQAQA